jgi:type IX secretion system PorP/SprF family membrane protein
MNDPANKKNTTDAMAAGQRMNFVDFSTGGVIFSDLLWVGVTLNHLNRPDQSFGSASDRIPVKTTLSLGYKFYFEDPTTIREFREKSLIPTLIYRTQGKFDQLDVGLYGIYDPVMIGVWYRGLPVKRYSEQFSNHDAIVAMAGLNFGALAVAYSYDFTISGLTGYSKGAHEISVLLEFYKPYSVKRKVRDVPCPKFYGQRKRGAVLIH